MLDMVLKRSLKWPIFTSIVYPLLFKNHSLDVIHMPINLLSLESYKTYNLYGKNKYSYVICKFLVIDERCCVLQEQQGRVEILIGILAKTQIYISVFTADQMCAFGCCHNGSCVPGAHLMSSNW